VVILSPISDDSMPNGHGRRAWLIAMAALAAAPAFGAAKVIAERASGARTARTALDAQGRTIAVPPAGRAVALNFWATWCEPCRTEMPTLQLAAELYADKLSVLALNFKEHPRTVARFVKASGLELPVAFDTDGAIAADWGVKIFPTTLLIAADGTPRWRVQGELDWSGREAARLIESLWA
jgi:thiol-disulfide isomerase/thioredoxin